MHIIVNQIDYNLQETLNQYIPVDKLKLYLDILEKENKKVNIVSRETSRNSLEVLIAESILPLSYIDQDRFEKYLDIGSGGGLPSIPMILSGAVSSSLLIERKKKKSDILYNIIKMLDLHKTTEIVNNTVEDLKLTGQFDLITLRLVKLTPKLFSKINPLLSNKSILIYYSIPDNDVIHGKFKIKSYSYPNKSKTDRKSFTLISKS